jgi:hypothetical protein
VIKSSLARGYDARHGRHQRTLLTLGGCTTLTRFTTLGLCTTAPFVLFNGMVYPVAPYGVKGMIWYQGENRETTSQSTDSYYLKEKALQQGWKRLWGMDDFPMYVVQLAGWLALPGWPLPRHRHYQHPLGRPRWPQADR